MTLNWLHITLLCIIFVNTACCFRHMYTDLYQTTNPGDWRTIEMLAEEHPYIVALLSGVKDYICTGSIVSKNCILTTGNCVVKNPKYVAVATAVYSRKVNSNTIFKVASTIVHGDYVFELQTGDPNVTRMHSNIGLVYVNRPLLEIFINVAELGNFFATELQNKKVTAIGYGGLGRGNLVGLQHQTYQQTPCMNPKWYYCVCGVEHNTRSNTYIAEFGTGAPTLLNSLVIGISSAPCGSLSVRNLGVKYNVFTVVGPYSGWIQKWTNKSINTKLVYDNNESNIKKSTLLKPLHILLIIISKIFL